MPDVPELAILGIVAIQGRTRETEPSPRNLTSPLTLYRRMGVHCCSQHPDPRQNSNGYSRENRFSGPN